MSPYLCAASAVAKRTRIKRPCLLHVYIMCIRKPIIKISLENQRNKHTEEDVDCDRARRTFYSITILNEWLNIVKDIYFFLLFFTIIMEIGHICIAIWVSAQYKEMYTQDNEYAYEWQAIRALGPKQLMNIKCGNFMCVKDGILAMLRITQTDVASTPEYVSNVECKTVSRSSASAHQSIV